MIEHGGNVIMSRKKPPGTILAALRQNAGLTQCNVAELVRNRRVVGLSEAHYRRIEKDIVTPSITLAMEIADVLESDVYQIWQ
jgi:DNA-binding XRE family transcriptional regulator